MTALDQSSSHGRLPVSAADRASDDDRSNAQRPLDRRAAKGASLRTRAGYAGTVTGLAWFFLALTPLAAAALAGVLVGEQALGALMHDVTRSANVHPLTGAISSMGAFLWFAAAAIAAFTLAMPTVRRSRERAAFLAAGMTLSLYFWFDDFFLFHEGLVPQSGLTQPVIYAVIVLAVVAYSWLFRASILAARPVLFATALAFLALSMGIDLALKDLMRGLGAWSVLVEDGLKWLGIVCWLAFHALACRELAAGADPDYER